MRIKFIFYYQKEKENSISRDEEFFASNDGSERDENISRNWGYLEYRAMSANQNCGHSLTLYRLFEIILQKQKNVSDISQIFSLDEWTKEAIAMRVDFHFYSTSKITMLFSIFQCKNFFIAKMLCAFLFIRKRSRTYFYRACSAGHLLIQS